MGCGFNGVAGSLGDEVDHLETLAFEDVAHVHMRLEEDVLITDGGCDGNHRRVCSESDGVEHA